MVDDPHAPQPGSVPGQPQAPTQVTQPQHVAAPPPGQPHVPPPGQHPTPGPQPGQPDAGAYPPGYAPPPGYGPPPGFAQPTDSGGGIKVGASVLWSLISVAAIALAVSLEEDGQNGWENIGVWAGFAIVAAVATLAPALRSNINLDAGRAWQIALAGAIGLAAFWVLFILPSIERNVSFLATVGVVAGGLAVWLAPGRPEQQAAEGQRW